MQKIKITEFDSHLLNLEINKNSNILVAMSGGVDSSVLTDLLLKSSLDLRISIFHLDHMYRVDSNEDYNLCENLAKKNNVDFYGYKINVLQKSQKSGLSFENYARKLRYELIYNLLKKNKYDFVMTAHHKDDNVESVFMNIIRGSGLSGLEGIKQKSYKIIRPLLIYTKSQLYEYANENNIFYREDYTNNDNIFYRNYLRNDIIPNIEKFFEIKLSDKVANLTQNIKNDNDYFNEIVSNEINNHFRIDYIFKCENDLNFNIDYIKYLHDKNYADSVDYNFTSKEIILEVSIEIVKLHISILSRLIFKIFEIIDYNKLDITKKNINNIIEYFNNSNISDVFEFKNIRFERRKKSFRILKKDLYNEIIKPYSYKLKLGENIIFNTKYKLNVEILINNFEKNNFNLCDENIKFYDDLELVENIKKEINNKNVLFIPIENISEINEIFIRNRKEGDYILQNFGKQKIKKIFSDYDFSSDIKYQIPFICKKNDILWLCGVRKSILNKININYGKFIKITLLDCIY